jgi:hypothetical protein
MLGNGFGVENSLSRSFPMAGWGGWNGMAGMGIPGMPNLNQGAVSMSKSAPTAPATNPQLATTGAVQQALQKANGDLRAFQKWLSGAPDILSKRSLMDAYELQKRA